MKLIWLLFVRAYISLGMFFYFRRIKIYGVQNVPKNKPVMLLSNHQNALLDALLIATKSGRLSYFLTRAGVFENSMIAKVLKSLRMLPVYRIRDGWGNLANNDAIFESCSKFLNNNACVVIFPEGNHSLNRTVRPLSKGFTRIVFNTFEAYPEVDLQLIPVGVNYVNAAKFPDSTSIYFGEPITAKHYVSGNKNEDVIKLKAKIQTEIALLTTDIPKDDYQNTLDKLARLNVDFLDPKTVNACVESNFQNCELQEDNNSTILKAFFKMVLICTFIGPFLIWKFVAKPKIKQIEFISTFRFAVAITLGPIWLTSLLMLFALTLGWEGAVAYLAASLVITLITVKL